MAIHRVLKPEQKILTKLQFRNKFTIGEKQAIYTAANTDIIIKIFLDDVNAAENINLKDPATIDGVNYLETQGHIAAGRAAEILEQ